MVNNLNFAPNSTKKVLKAAEVIKNSLPGTPKSKEKTLINTVNSQSPITKTNIMSNTNSTSSTPRKLDLALYYDTFKESVIDLVINQGNWR